MSVSNKPQSESASLTPLSGPPYHAMVIETANGFKVRPPVAAVNGALNRFFRFKNNTKHRAWLFLPPVVVDGPPGPIEVEPPFVEVPLRGGGVFSYVVVLETPGGIVTVPGESDPVIIIDPPAN